MTLTFNSAAYSELLVEVTPKAIETEAEYERSLAIAEKLTFNRSRTPEETALHKLLVILVEAYEAAHYPVPEVSPAQVLRHVMEASGTEQEDLVGVMGSSNVVSEILSGERAINQTQAKILAERFRVAPSLFL